MPICPRIAIFPTPPESDGAVQELLLRQTSGPPPNRKILQMKISLSIAEENHIPTIIGLLDEGAEWLHEVKRSDQWPRPHPAPHKRQVRLAQGIRAQRTWIGWADNTPIATITAGETGDPALWTEEELAEPAIYIHRLVVSRSYARKALGTELLIWPACEQPSNTERGGSASTPGRQTPHCTHTTCARGSNSSATAALPQTHPAPCSRNPSTKSPLHQSRYSPARPRNARTDCGVQSRRFTHAHPGAHALKEYIIGRACGIRGNGAPEYHQA